MNKIMHEVRLNRFRSQAAQRTAAELWLPQYESLVKVLGNLGTVIEHKVYQEEYPDPRIIRASEGVGYPRQPVRATTNFTEARDIGERHLIDTVQVYRGRSEFLGHALLRYNAEPGSLIVGIDIIDDRDQLPPAALEAIGQVFES